MALVEFSKHGQRVWSKPFKYAHIDVGLKIWNPHSQSLQASSASAVGAIALKRRCVRLLKP